MGLKIENRKNFKNRIESGEIDYDPVYDAYYYVATNQWAEKKCGNDACEFCAHRPDMHKSDD